MRHQAPDAAARPVKGLVLGAGLGTRLAPLTDQLAKPLFPVLNRPVVVHVIERLRAAGITEIAVNTFHLAEELEAVLGDGSALGVRITWFREPVLLGTGGILPFCAEFWRDATLLVTTNDMLSTLDLDEMLAFHRASGARATVATFEHSWPLEEWGGDVAVLAAGTSRVAEYQSKPGVEARGRHGATGTWIFEPEVLEHVPARESFDLNEDFLPPLAATGTLHAYAGTYEFEDFGQAEGYVRGTGEALAGRLGIRADEPEVAPGVHVHPTAVIAPGVRLEGPLAVGAHAVLETDCRIIGPTVVGPGATVGRGATLRESVLLPGVAVPAGMTVAGALLGNALTTPDAIRRYCLAELGREGAGRVSTAP
ncbi:MULTISPECIES: NDP-sugar synthase [Kitasatospora]|uniref:Putative nucleotidyl transferase n=1 Tax=Kitasatospora setae (strain ATCC 33774 / DSM 43861 / JCM 3304 / KCC A-0304 / NBRC 14216 / KM-6054) TaxID=452652 RepID=E4N9N2_KITSK|nr:MULTISPECIES: NDP-sugar synthase [Kitasatospora]BAJ27913.1 putative nucleotidyl transferase [Kitasatospora setae KM-6054]